jgi:protein CpxP
MKALFRVILVAAGFSVAALPAARAADEAPPAAPASPNAAAQPDRPERRGPRMDPAQRLQRLTEVLGLTEDQQAKIKSIFQEEAGKSQAIMDDSSLSREDRRAKRQELRTDMQARVRAMLTPEQQTTFDAMPRPGRGPRGEGPAGESPPPPPPPPPAGGSA